MQSAPSLLLLYTEAATKAIEAIGGVNAFKTLPLFGSNERKNTLAAWPPQPIFVETKPRS